MPRYKLLGVEDVELAVPITGPTGPAGPKADVEVVFAGHDPAGEGFFTFQVPPYDPKKFNVLEALHVSLYEKLADGTAAPVPSDPAQIVTHTLHYSTGCASLTGGGTVVVDATAAPAAPYNAALVAQFDA